MRERFAPEDPRFDQVHAALLRLIPALEGAAITHRWGGPLGIARDWSPRVGVFRAQGLATAGGYVGEGVGASNLAARTLADGILGRESERTSLPWVADDFQNWEIEPLRWLGVSAVRHLGDRLDEAERAGRAVPRLAQALWSAFVRH